eukprot:scaffold2658_cov246-Pinguiococcus_pyrenoidosus.AAC.5
MLDPPHTPYTPSTLGYPRLDIVLSFGGGGRGGGGLRSSYVSVSFPSPSVPNDDRLLSFGGGCGAP